MDSSQRVRAIISFIHAVDAGSLAAAARMLGVTSAAVSKNVASLEATLGVRLLNRTTRSLTLTEEGDAFLRQARIALEALDNAVDTVAAKRATVSGRVRISTSASFGREHLLPTLRSLMTRHPELAIEIDFDDRVVDLVRDGYDLAVRGGSIPDSALVTRPIFKMEAVLVASPAYLEKHGVPQSPNDLAKHRLIARRFLGGAVTPWSFQSNDGSIITIDPSESACLTLSAPESLIDAACADLGIARVGIHLALDQLRQKKLKLILLGQHLPGQFEMVIQYPHRALLAPRVQAVVEHLLSEFENQESLHTSLKILDEYRA